MLSKSATSRVALGLLRWSTSMEGGEQGPTSEELREQIERAGRAQDRADVAIDRLLERLRLDRLRCVECRAPWDDPSERFRCYLTAEEPGNSVVLLCPSCAAAEFD